MVCKHCGTSNHEDDHRCHQCGRRLGADEARRAPDVYPVAGSRALAPRLVTRDAPEAQPEEQAPASRRGPRQAPLFSTVEIGRVVPIVPRRAPRTNSRRSGPAPIPPEGTGQQSLAFHAPAKNRARQALPETERCSDAPVAPPMQRMVAAAADFSLVAIAVGVVMTGGDLLSGGRLVTTGTLPWFGALAVFLGACYKLLWALADTESPGLRWTNLELLDFDGAVPNRSQRLQRLAAGCLSVMAGMVGVLWALVDEETLSWHDHMSKTFLTPSTGRQGFRR